MEITAAEYLRDTKTWTINICNVKEEFYRTETVLGFEWRSSSRNNVGALSFERQSELELAFVNFVDVNRSEKIVKVHASTLVVAVGALKKIMETPCRCTDHYIMFSLHGHTDDCAQNIAFEAMYRLRGKI